MTNIIQAKCTVYNSFVNEHMKIQLWNKIALLPVFQPFSTFSRRSTRSHFSSSFIHNRNKLTMTGTSKCIDEPGCVFISRGKTSKQYYIDGKYYSSSTRKRHTISLYDVLGVTPKATQTQIKSAYYKLSKIHHPDTKMDGVEHKMFLDINEAYEVLGNIRKRRLYDRGVFNPQQHDDDDDKDDSHFTETRPFTQREGFKMRRKPPTGRSNVYNFDEFYRQHYPELMQRKKKDIQHDIKQREEEKLRIREEKIGSTTCLLLVLFTFVVFILR